MTLIITENINPADQEELLTGLREFNLRFLDPAQFGELGVYSRDAAGEMRGGLIKAAKAFGGAKAYDISIACPCRECDVRSPGCGRICSDYKKYKFVLAILNGKRQAKAKAAAECREMRNERIREWKHNKCWPKG